MSGERFAALLVLVERINLNRRLVHDAIALPATRLRSNSLVRVSSSDYGHDKEACRQATEVLARFRAEVQAEAEAERDRVLPQLADQLLGFRAALPALAAAAAVELAGEEAELRRGVQS